MRRLTTTSRPRDGGPHHRSDGGCAPNPGPVQRADDWRDNLGESDTFDGPPGGQAAPAVPDPRPYRPTPPWPPRSSEVSPRPPRRVDRGVRLRYLAQTIAFVLLCVAAAYSSGSWAAGGWLALAGWFVLGVLSLFLVGWVLEGVEMRRLDRELADRLTRRRA